MFTWVNGSDPVFQRQLRHTVNNNLAESHEDDVKQQRFEDFNQLVYAMRSIEKYFSWARHIYIVTNGQVPSWLNRNHSRVTLVNHKDIFNHTNHLPTFNSMAIEGN